MISTEEWLRLQITGLCVRQPFLGVLATCLELEPSADFPIAATDGHRLLYNPDRFERLRRESAHGCGQPPLMPAEFIIAHQALHSALRHPQRRKGRLRLPWNAACDLAANLALADAGFDVPRGALLDERLGGMAEERIYDAFIHGKIAPIGVVADLIESPDRNADGIPDATWRDRIAAATARTRGKLPKGIATLLSAVAEPTQLPDARQHEASRLSRTIENPDDILAGRTTRAPDAFPPHALWAAIDAVIGRLKDSESLEPFLRWSMRLPGSLAVAAMMDAGRLGARVQRGLFEAPSWRAWVERHQHHFAAAVAAHDRKRGLLG
jgi:hypothetical protein